MRSESEERRVVMGVMGVMGDGPAEVNVRSS